MVFRRNVTDIRRSIGKTVSERRGMEIERLIPSHIETPYPQVPYSFWHEATAWDVEPFPPIFGASIASIEQLFQPLYGFVESGGSIKQDVLEPASGLLGPTGEALSASSERYKSFVVEVGAVNEDLLRMLREEPENFWALSPRRLEEVVAELLHRQGYEVTLTPPSRDGGFDVAAAKKERLGSFLYFIDCKRFRPPSKVGVEVVRRLYGVVQSRHATAGAVVTTSYFTAGAKEFQRQVEYQMALRDYVALQDWISEVVPPAMTSSALPAVPPPPSRPARG